MVNVFDKLYSSIENKNTILQKIKFYSVLRFSIRVIANIIIPMYFKCTKHNKKYSLKKETKNNPRLIVSLTSFPARINNLWLVIETIFRQKVKPDMIILWLSKEQFLNIDSLPKRLLKQRERGLKIELREGDLRSHKKYFYTLNEYPNDIMITIDDDVYYNFNLISELILTHNKFPYYIICNHASKIVFQNNEILPYINWENIKNELGPTNQILPIGVGGILYPPNSMYKDVLNAEIFKKYCFLADDIWLNTMSRLNNTLIVKTNFYSHYLPILNKSNITLSQTNVLLGLNDKQLELVRKYCIDNYNKDPFYLL